MRRFTLLLLLAVMAVSAFAQQDTVGEAVVNEGTVNEFMRHSFGYDPNIQWKIVALRSSRVAGVTEVVVTLKNSEGQGNVRFYILPDQLHAIVGDMMPFGADPFAPARTELFKRANGPSKGPENAPVTIVEFSDLQCPSCKAAQPTIDKLLAEVPNARFVFQNFPLETLHPWAFKGASFATCVASENNAKFWKFLELVYANQESITPENADSKLVELASQAGVDGSAVAKCAVDPATAARVRDSLQLGLDVGVNSTPTLFINGRGIANVGSMPPEMLKSIVDFEAKNAAGAK